MLKVRLVSERYSKISLTFLFISFTLLLITARTTIEIFPPDPFYLFFNLPFFYWIGIIFLIGLIIIRLFFMSEITKITQIIDIALLGLLTCYYSVISFIYPTIRYVDAYNFYNNFIHPIGISGVINPTLNDSYMYLLIYNASTIFFSIVFQFDLPQHVLANSFPICVIFLGSIVTYRLSTTYSNKYNVIGGLVFIVFYWGACHVAPQHYTYIIIFFILFVIFRLLDTGNAQYTVLMLFLFGVLIVSHLLSNIIVIYLLILLTILFFLYKFLSLRIHNILPSLGEYKKIKNQLVIPLIILFVGFVTYLIYISLYYFKKIISAVDMIVSSVLEYDPDEISLVHRTVSHTIPSELYIYDYQIRMSVLILYLIFSIIFTILIIRSYRKNTENIINFRYCILTIFVFFILFSFGAFLLATGNSSYGFGRSYPISLIPFGMLSMVFFTLPNSKDWLLCVIKILFIVTIISLIIIQPVVKYGSDPYHFISESEDHANQFDNQYYQNGGSSKTSIQLKAFSLMMYNSKELKEQKGNEYAKQFQIPTLNLIYSVGKTKQYYY